jgi:hypothetical protein
MNACRWLRRTPVALCSALVCCAAFLPASAVADGDPASDVLLVEDVFYPYQPPPGRGLEASMKSALHAAAAVGLRLKVAIIGSAEELGLVPRLFGRPQAYANFLDSEISFNSPQPLLVVMPAGFGLANAGSATVLRGLSVDGTHGPAGLTRSAIRAVVNLGRARGSRAAIPPLATGAPARSGPPALLVFGLPTLLLALGGLFAWRRGRLR